MQLLQASNARHVTLAYLCGLTLILYLDRMCIGKAAPFIQDELGLSDERMGYIHAAFMLSYGLFEVVTGHWGDRFGSRRVLIRIVLWWSAFTALTGAAGGFAWLRGRSPIPGTAGPAASFSWRPVGDSGAKEEAEPIKTLNE